MRKNKKIISILLTLLMILSLIPAAAFAEAAENCEGNCAHEAAIGTTHYDTLADAVSAAKDNDTVTLLENVELQGSFIKITKPITVDFGEYTVSGVNCTTYPQALFQITGNTVTFKGGNGGIEAKAGTYGTRAIAIESNSKLVIESGVYSSMNNCTIYADNAGAALEIKGGKFETKSNTSSGNFKQTVTIDGDLTVTGGTIINNVASSSQNLFQVDGNNSKVSISGANITANAGTVVKADNDNVDVEIKNCTVSTVSGALVNGGKITVKEGTEFISNSGRVIKGAKSVSIEGGTFQTENAFGYSSFILNIKGGKFNVKQLTTNANSTNLKISGGEFQISDATNAKQVVDNYVAPTEESGNVEVTVNETLYGQNESGDIVVIKKLVTINAEADDFTYGEVGKTGYKNVSAKVSTEEVSGLAETLTATYYKETETSGTYETTGIANTPTDAGNYKVVLSVPETNAVYYGNKELYFTIKKADQIAPASGEGYTIDYANEKIKASNDKYEVSSSNEVLIPLTDDKLSPGTTYYVRLKEDDNHNASQWTAINVASRPAAPVGVTAQQETIVNKGDAYLRGVTESMEYRVKVDSGEYEEWITGFGTSIGFVFDVTPNPITRYDVEVRTKATTTQFAGESAVFTFTPNTTDKLTVTMGESTVQVAYGSKVSKPETDPIMEGYTFGGWYRDIECTQAWNFGVDTVTEDITLYAKWIKNDVKKANISGTVTQKAEPSDTIVSNATVDLLLGTVKVAATVTDENGGYSFSNVENGKYNIVVTTADDSKTKTELVTIKDENAIVDVVLPIGKVNSVIEHQVNEVEGTKSNISQTVVGGLDDIAASKNLEEGDKITIKLKVEPKAAEEVESAEEIITIAGSDKKVEFLDLSLLMQKNDEDEESIGNSNTTLLTIVIPFDFTTTDVNSITILRKHENEDAEQLTMNPAEGEEGFTIDEAAGTITIYAKKFSDYAIAYKESDPQDDPAPIHFSPVPQAPTVVTDNGSEATLYAYGSSLDITVKEGYQLLDVTLNGESKGKVTTLTGLKTGDEVVVKTAVQTVKYFTEKEVKEIADQLKLKVTTKYVTKSGKKVVQATAAVTEGKAKVLQLIDSGYTVKYAFYRGTAKKTSSLKKMYTTKNSKYTNTSGTKGKTYYYKAVLRIYDANGKYVCQTSLGQCKYGQRKYK